MQTLEMHLPTQRPFFGHLVVVDLPSHGLSKIAEEQRICEHLIPQTINLGKLLA